MKTYHRHTPDLVKPGNRYVYCKLCGCIPSNLLGAAEMCKENVHRDHALDKESAARGEPLAHQGYETAANTCEGPPVSHGPKCIVAGCSNHFGEGVFHGELCAPCHRMLVTGHVQPAGFTFVHELAGTVRRQKRTPVELRQASLSLLNELAPHTRRDDWWTTQGPSYIVQQHLEKYHEKGQS